MYKKIAISIILALVVLQSFAISDHTLYFMRDLPLVNTLNPAFQPKRGKVYVGFPVLTSIHTSFELSPSIDLYNKPVFIDKEVGKLKPYETAGFAMGVRLLDIGIVIKDMYFTLGVETKMIGSVILNSDIAKLAISGNGYFADKNIPADFQKTGLDLAAYHEISLGFSKQILPEELTVGGNVKYLIGVAGANVGLDNGSYLHTNNDTYALHLSANPVANIAVPLGLEAAQNVTFQSILSSLNTDNLLKIENAYTPQGHGVAFDLGASWSVRQTNKKLNISLSVLDLGFIRWTNNYQVASHNQKPTRVDITGVDINNTSAFFSSLADTILNAKVDGAYKNNTTRLAGRGYLGINYAIWKYLNAGFLFGLNSYNGLRYDPSYTFSINTQNFMVNLAASYTIKNGRYDDLGLGVVFGRKYLQVHLLLDNVLRTGKQISQLSSGVDITQTALNLKSMNFRFGINFLFGNNDQERKFKQQRREMKEAEAIEKLKQKANKSTTSVTQETTTK